MAPGQSCCSRTHWGENMWAPGKCSQILFERFEPWMRVLCPATPTWCLGCQTAGVQRGPRRDSGKITPRKNCALCSPCKQKHKPAYMISYIISPVSYCSWSLLKLLFKPLLFHFSHSLPCLFCIELLYSGIQQNSGPLYFCPNVSGSPVGTMEPRCNTSGII